jgi:hypothetical protein
MVPQKWISGSPRKLDCFSELVFNSVEFNIGKFRSFAQKSNGKRMPRRFSLILVVQTEVCRLSVCWRRNKQKLAVCNRTYRLNGLSHLCHLAEYHISLCSVTAVPC